MRCGSPSSFSGLLKQLFNWDTKIYVKDSLYRNLSIPAGKINEYKYLPYIW
jgi:hypothetical protein